MINSSLKVLFFKYIFDSNKLDSISCPLCPNLDSFFNSVIALSSSVLIIEIISIKYPDNLISLDFLL